MPTAAARRVYDPGVRRSLLACWTVLVTLVVGAAPAPAAPAPAPGTFAGSLGVQVPRGAEAEVRAIDRSTGAVAATGRVGRTGAFRLRLPAGAYTVIGTVVPRARGAKPITVVSGVSLRPGQRRTKANLKRKRKKQPKRARAAFVQEKGQVTPGRVALEIPDVTAAGTLDRDFEGVRTGLNDLALTDILGGRARAECGVAVIEVDRRADVIRELEFQQSPYVDPATRGVRNLILGDVEVRGTARQLDADRAEITYALRDKRTGADLGSVTATAGSTDFFGDIERLNARLADVVCKLSDTYDVTIDVDGRGDYPLYTATAQLQGTLRARRTDRRAKVWTRTGPIAWTTPVVVPKAECALIDPVVPSPSWTVTLSLSDDDRLRVDWGLGAGEATTLSLLCPGDPTPPPIPFQPATAMHETGPGSFLVPFSGGVQPLRGGISFGGIGSTNTGTITVKPGPIARVDD